MDCDEGRSGGETNKGMASQAERSSALEQFKVCRMFAISAFTARICWR
jgi:hypothetical protein